MQNLTAIVLDIDGKGIVTQGISDAKVRYDWDGDGLADQTGWIGSGDAFLFLDSDGNGKITGRSELTFGPAGLGSLDTTGDGAITVADADWGQLKVWQDKNGNGVVDAGEVLSLDAAGIRSIAVALTPATSATASDGATTLAAGSYTRTNGTSQSLAEVSLGYLSAPVDGLPTLDFFDRSYDQKSKRYRITAKDGEFFVTGKHFGVVDSRAGGLNGATMLQFRNRSFGMLDALVLDLDGNGVSLVRRKKSHALFDMNGDGRRDDPGWISKSDGFLVIDRNNDGLISGPSELNFMSEDPTAKNSLAGLLALDSNGDKILDKNDARFGELKIWVDANGNGVSDPGELKALSDLGIVSIDLTAHNATGSAKVGDNLLLATATFTRDNGTLGTMGDVALAFAPATPGPAPNAPSNQLPTTEVTLAASPQAVPTNGLEKLPGSGVLAAAANQFASAIAAFATPASVGEIDPRRDVPTQVATLLAPPAQH